MTANQYQFIESQALCSALKASGIHSNTQIYIVAVPTSQLGLNNGSLYGAQGRKHITAMMNVDKSKYISGIHLRDLMEEKKLEIGCAINILSNNFPALVK